MKQDLFTVLATVLNFSPALNLRDIAMICPENFSLPGDLAKRLRRLSSTIHNGRGFVVLRGLTPEEHSDEENVIAFCGIGCYIGRSRYANAYGMAMG